MTYMIYIKNLKYFIMGHISFMKCFLKEAYLFFCDFADFTLNLKNLNVKLPLPPWFQEGLLDK